ncbi:hypothetical protein GCM10011521_23350 [Arenimonas soli]|uniref:Class GN sortase n=1 Tax=Arenimonas soli TaxID=2269504 RepID=A0ABQ1HNW1_9GAMM|nr:class GN sortase [Arenimonas soli]GGA84300.1 hypothetical protein GCM10011521_23350 [Arenimonas soli]
MQRRVPRPRALRGSAAPARRCLARALLLAAGLLAVQAAWLPAKAALAQGLLAASWQQSLADGEPHRPWPWADTHAVARLSSPRLGISQVVLAGDSGRSLAFGPGWAESSASPGTRGTVVISGHRDTHFRWLQDLRHGDVLDLQSRDGPRRYEVAATRVADARHERIVATDHDQLLLVTCWPFDATAARGPLRYLVTLRPLPSASSR